MRDEMHYVSRVRLRLTN